MMTDVTVIIPTYNRATLVTRAIESVLGQTLRVHEVVVVDDGSTDDTAKRLQAFGTDIRIITQTNAGPSAARNRGLEAATGSFICFLDSDDQWLPNKIELQLQQFRDFPSLDFVFADIEVIAPDGGSDREIPEGVARNRFFSSTGPLPEMFEALVSVNFTVTSTVMLRAEVVKRIGFMDEQFHLCEDLDYWLRATGAGCRFGFLPIVLTRRFKHAENLVNDWSGRVHAQIAVLDKQIAEGSGFSKGCVRLIEERIASLHYDLGSHYLRQGRFRDARGHLRQARGNSVPNRRRIAKALVARLLGSGSSMHC